MSGLGLGGRLIRCSLTPRPLIRVSGAHARCRASQDLAQSVWIGTRGFATSAAGPSSQPSKKKGKKSRGRVSEDSLAPLDSICIRNASPEPAPAQPPRETKEDRRSMAVADKFFRHGYKFLYSADQLYTHPANESTPEVVVLGASNAGKSTFLNGLFGRSDAARVSARPGHTITMNGFGVGRLPSSHANLATEPSTTPTHGLVMVDTPGYGHMSRSSWGDSICNYVEKRSMLKGAIVLIPAQKNLTSMDRWVLRMLAERNKRTLVILTKADMAGRDWWAGCNDLAGELRREMGKLERRLGNGWTEGDGWVPDIYATAAGWTKKRSIGAAPGMAGARRAILERLAGFTLEEKVDSRPEDIAYEGELISWDDLLTDHDK